VDRRVLDDDDITSGKLVSFLLYLSSLSDAFNNMGSILTAFTQALGAADKGTCGLQAEPPLTYPIHHSREHSLRAHQAQAQDRAGAEPHRAEGVPGGGGD
jgi:ABC-type multidrug transport system fused ATPase/permease subunit